jgi:DNA adenine methylase
LSTGESTELAPASNSFANVSFFLPFLKWAGGKRQMLGKIAPLVPPQFHNYFEPFLGGGALFFYLASRAQVDPNFSFHAFLSDSNPQLINAYLAVKDNVEQLIKILKRHQKNYERSPETYYYQMRKQWDTDSLTIDQAARLIALNRTCYNGLYRVNRQGKFNVPLGSYANPSICDEVRLRNDSIALNRVSASIKAIDFELALKDAREGDFVYLDPPFDPLSSTSNFVSYTKDGFAVAEQKRLARVFKDLDRRGCRVLLSNSDTVMIRDIYSNYQRTTVLAQNVQRAINCRGALRTNSTELLITNYYTRTDDLDRIYPEH